ncbi:glycosyltransferase family 4 protein [Halorubrum ezzemoulense]|uniref:glycosyltransferase family 4 protein n=1 Tax=Halorubrum ezzemoulense TaxID=337243 RepID=UPI00232E6B41|nr:glycosyltransferase family 4 protein [Halorubrum ezzemoulense]MDB9250748.1 glycosyltransferase family 4 protein [Halorubrum ezzemoulense]MDB9260885.1 glycosyltransferase family 4 protein [Halorubrum ezzemoulense]MDB9264293.1 glycosyltransferase family 4 protein [Halorubrum ezzemoulense]MDB9267785.1 glycosyltransferase family 4 protein [Halorubrum ezzemoulense]MDB9271246.1 glycosyltransferase family 4 protein [Halorubrum ezzemoulense]
MARHSSRRILLCADYLPPSDGGVEQVVQKLAVHLVAEGYEVGVFTLDDGSREFDLTDNPDVSFYTASAIDLTDTIGLQSMFSLSALREFGDILETFQPDIIHAHNRFFYTSALAALYSLRADYKLVTTLHLGDIGMISGIGGVAARTFEQTVSRFVISRSDQVICVSAAAESIARSLGATRTTVIRNAVDVEEFAPLPVEEKSLLYIGRLVRNNGIQDLLSALPGVLEAHPDATVDIVGSGPLKADVQETIRQTGISDAVTVHDYVPDISAMYDRASVFCRPSYSEGLPLTMLEAMASGVPPVVTAIAGVPEVVTDRETGLLLEPGRPDEIEAALIELFDDDVFRMELADNARDYVVNNLTWEQRTQKVSDVYQRLSRDATNSYRSA